MDFNDYLLKFHKEDIKYSSDVINALEEQAKWAREITDFVKELSKKLKDLEKDFTFHKHEKENK